MVIYVFFIIESFPTKGKSRYAISFKKIFTSTKLAKRTIFYVNNRCESSILLTATTPSKLSNGTNNNVWAQRWKGNLIWNSLYYLIFIVT